MMRVRTQFTGPQGAPWLSTMFFKANTEDATTAQAASTAVGAFWTAIRAYIGTAVAWSTLPQVDYIDPIGTHTGADAVTPSANTGSAAGALLPLASQMLVQWRTGIYIQNREARGRTFIPGVASLVLASNGTPSSATLTAVQGAANTLLGNATAHLCLWQRRWAGDPTVVSGGPWAQFATLRSRRD